MCALSLQTNEIPACRACFALCRGGGERFGSYILGICRFYLCSHQVRGHEENEENLPNFRASKTCWSSISLSQNRVESVA